MMAKPMKTLELQYQMIQFLIIEISRLVYTTKVNSTFRARWLASSEVISQVLFTSGPPKKNKMAFDGILSQLVTLWSASYSACWYILKQLFTSVSVKVVDIYLHFGEELWNISQFSKLHSQNR